MKQLKPDFKWEGRTVLAIRRCGKNL